MPLNMVTLTGTFIVSPTDTTAAEGNYVLIPDGSGYAPTANEMVNVRITEGVLSSGAMSVAVLASDNFDVNTLTYTIKIDVRGMSQISVPNVDVNFTNGASQNIFTVLLAAGWIPEDSNTITEI